MSDTCLGWHLVIAHFAQHDLDAVTLDGSRLKRTEVNG